MSRSVVQFAQANGFGSPLTSESGYKQSFSDPLGRASAPTSVRQPLQPSGTAAPPPTISTSSARPKPSNACIPYSRTAEAQIDAGEIVLVKTVLSFLRVDPTKTPPGLLSAIANGKQMRVGSGTSSYSSVRTIEQVNKRLFDLRGEPDEVLQEASSWTVDGVCIGSETDDPDGYHFRDYPLVNVAVYGPTPLVNDDERRAFSRSEHNAARIFVGLFKAKTVVPSPNPLKLVPQTFVKYKRFSTRDLHFHEEHKANFCGDPELEADPLIFAWRIGRIMDRSLGMKFKDSALLHVDISPPFFPTTELPNKHIVNVIDDGEGIRAPIQRTYKVTSDLLFSLKDFVPE